MLFTRKKSFNAIKKFTIIRKILRYSFLSSIIIISSFFIFNLSIKYNNKKNSELNKIKKEIKGIEYETKELETKAKLTKIYINTYNSKISEKQKEKGNIDINYVKELFNKIASKYPVSNLNITFSVPSKVEHFSKIENKLMNMDINISFNSLTEYDIYYFINDLLNDKSFFLIIESLDIKKNKNINKELLKEIISNGESVTTLSTNIKIQLYKFSGK